MLSFACDYSEGAHERILQRLLETNREQTSGYGEDPYTESAKEKIQKAAGKPGADVFFLLGGTQTNRIVISAVLAPYQGVIAADSGHISVHESGAVENAGHKVLTLPGEDGKLRASDVRELLESFYGDENREHMVYPGMVYISYPTESGTLYSRKELEDLHAVCREYGIPLYVDGARLGYGIMSPGSDVTLPVLADCCDIFYIGGTKNGALFGEAVVFPGGDMPAHFFTMVKQQGALLAKGRILGLQFDTLFTDNLYFEIAKNAVDRAGELREILVRKGYELGIPTVSNQIFVILEDSRLEELKKKVAVSFWCRMGGGRTMVRFATSWATTKEQVRALEEIL